jgi:adenylate cyclase
VWGSVAPVRLAIAACAAVTLAMIAVYFTKPPLLEHLERRSYDLRLQALPHEPPTHVTLAAVDERSLADIGRWPWSRATMASLTHALSAAGARVIAFDVFFAERESPAADQAFARELRQAGNAVLGTVFLMRADEARYLDADALHAARRAIEPQAIEHVAGELGPVYRAPDPQGVLANLPELQSAAARTGHVNVDVDPDGVVRRVALVQRADGRFFPSFDVQVARTYLGAPPPGLELAPYGIAGLRLGGEDIPLDEEGRLLIRYRGPPGSFDTVSIADILAGRADPALLRGRVVLVGNTAQGIGDMRVTPFGSPFPGVEVRASIIENLLQGDFLQRPGWLSLIDVAGLLVLGVLLSWLLPRLGVAAGGLLAAGAAAGILLVSDFVLRAEGLWLSAVYPLMLVALLFVTATLAFYFSAYSEKRYLKHAFQHYVPPAVVEEIARDPKRLRLGGEKRDLTVLFSDIRGFTTLSETMDPEALVRFMNRYFTAMTARVFEEQGSLDKFIGDGLMAVYGAPVALAGHAAHACRAALAMSAALAELNRDWLAEGLPAVAIGIGIHSGPVVVGNMGSAERFNYTVAGDTVNVAARIEALNKDYGTEILASEATLAQLGEPPCPTREIDVLRVRGRAQHVRLFELIPAGRYASLDWLEDYRAAYAVMRGGDPARAAALFEALHARAGDRASARHAEACRQLHRRPADRG